MEDVKEYTETEQGYLTLKWGTVKAWKFTSEKGQQLAEEYKKLGYSFSAMQQRDTDRQKEIICEMIDIMPNEIYLDWDMKYISKEEAKEYVKNYKV